jgi:hypothetical protein
LGPKERRSDRKADAVEYSRRRAFSCSDRRSAIPDASDDDEGGEDEEDEEEEEEEEEDVWRRYQDAETKAFYYHNPALGQTVWGKESLPADAKVASSSSSSSSSSSPSSSSGGL